MKVIKSSEWTNVCILVFERVFFGEADNSHGMQPICFATDDLIFLWLVIYVSSLEWDASISVHSALYYVERMMTRCKSAAYK